MDDSFPLFKCFLITKKSALKQYNFNLIDPEHLEEQFNNPNSYTIHTFSFDYMYDQDNSQEEVYYNTARDAEFSAFNVTIMAYGQTGTRHFQWRDLITIVQILKEESSQVQTRKYLSAFQMDPMNSPS
ncbi:unnamed protein product (macronuclear) [Paramecium tetraurelia]|uniref:Kinesin motor domain-containing protein n=1 Tax=Paramecium tetraurelia TaxID=5888 RepID=A0CUY9_PARTE|nr:uncharacterized protein GSPATT00010774001 [Paramecium tetraurelia]CAK74606.1 unnamed protein product [Paramecium tetraurelia]|eukprot:XP_001442003.1 hypothetical protein (macronuclear) [Paramecium tetraurelia strain d4-2]